ncbi:Nif3-like dinuclear metal center hexameric protein [Methanogenium cariaci]|uniref:Nif3-like dinuclear metal center hexameric protein n=1 Tax=Methanogenium cariaci TaxID=2197 RepID=UPI00248189F5|nr:Nif3-like dinuclear metal center hexameric protein [Methanogenium cariaci]
MHTNFDHAEGGINDALAETLRLTEVVPLSLGVIGTLTRSLNDVSELLGAPPPHLRGGGASALSSCCRRGGSGGFSPT